MYASSIAAAMRALLIVEFSNGRIQLGKDPVGTARTAVAMISNHCGLGQDAAEWLYLCALVLVRLGMLR